MYAILRSGGKQVKVAPGDVVRLERTAGARVAKGDRLELSEVILVSGDGGTRTGQKAVSGVKVVATESWTKPELVACGMSVPSTGSARAIKPVA